METRQSLIPPLVELGDLNLTDRVGWSCGMLRSLVNVMKPGEYKVSAHMSPNSPEFVETLFIIHADCEPSFAAELVEDGKMWIHMGNVHTIGGLLHLSNRRNTDSDAEAFRNFYNQTPSIIGAAQITPSLIVAHMLSGSYVYGMTAIMPLNRNNGNNIVGTCLTHRRSYAYNHQIGDAALMQALRDHPTYGGYFY